MIHGNGNNSCEKQKEHKSVNHENGMRASSRVVERSN